MQHLKERNLLVACTTPIRLAASSYARSSKTECQVPVDIPGGVVGAGEGRVWASRVAPVLDGLVVDDNIELVACAYGLVDHGLVRPGAGRLATIPEPGGDAGPGRRDG